MSRAGAPALAGAAALAATALGGGCLSLPYAVGALGVVGGFGAVVLAALANGLTCCFLVDVALAAVPPDSETLVDYEALVFYTLGRRWRVVAGLGMLGVNYLAVVGYLVLLADNVGQVLRPREAGADSASGVRVVRFAVIAGASLLALSVGSMKRLGSMFGTNLVAIAALAFLLCSFCRRTVQCAFDPAFAADAARCPGMADPGTVEPGADDHFDLWPGGLGPVLLASPVIFTAFFFHSNVMAVFYELPTPRRTAGTMRAVIWGSLGLVAAIYGVLGLCGYLLLGGKTCGNVLESFHGHDPLILSSRIAVSVTLLFSLPLLILPSRRAIFRMYASFAVGRTTQTSREKAVGERAPLLPAAAPEDTEDGGARAGPPGADPEDEEEERVEAMLTSLEDSLKVRLGFSVPMMVVAAAVALKVPGILIVWSLEGGVLITLMGFVLPSLMKAAVVTRGHLESYAATWAATPYYLFASGMLVLGAVCTVAVVLGAHGAAEALDGGACH